MASFIKISSMEKTSTDNSDYADSPEYKRGIEKRIKKNGIHLMNQKQISGLDIEFFSEILILSMNEDVIVSTKQLHLPKRKMRQTFYKKIKNLLFLFSIV